MWIASVKNVWIWIVVGNDDGDDDDATEVEFRLLQSQNIQNDFQCVLCVCDIWLFDRYVLHMENDITLGGNL